MKHHVYAYQLLIALTVVAAALLILWSLPVNGDEARALWVVRDHPVPNATFTERIKTDLQTLAERVRQQTVSPLYALALDVWTQLVGHDVRIARQLSLALAVVAACVMAATMGRAALNLAAVLLIAVAAFLPAVRADGYAAVLLASALATWALLWLNRRPSISRALVYTVALTALTYTAPVILPLLLLHVLVTEATGGAYRFVLGAMLAAILLYLPWLLVMKADARTMLISAETLIAWLVAALPVILWVVVHVQRVPQRWSTATAITTGLLLVMVCAGLLMMNAPGYLAEVRALRAADEPVLYTFPHDQPVNYYNARAETTLTGGLAVDVGWREDDALLQRALSAVKSAPDVWVMLPADSEDWTIIDSHFGRNAVLEYDHTAQGMRIVRYAHQENRK